MYRKNCDEEEQETRRKAEEAAEKARKEAEEEARKKAEEEAKQKGVVEPSKTAEEAPAQQGAPGLVLVKGEDASGEFEEEPKPSLMVVEDKEKRESL